MLGTGMCRCIQMMERFVVGLLNLKVFIIL